MPRKSRAGVAGASGKLVRDLFLGFMRVHTLHHAAKEPVFGLEMIEELRRHGHSLGPGTMYPMLHALEEAGVLRSVQTLVNGRNRKYYRTTPLGDALLAELRVKLREFVDEILELPAPAKHVKAKGARPGRHASRDQK